MEQDIRFGPYRFELRTGRLWRDGDEVHLTPKASAVLRELVTRPGSPVSRDDLFAAVWAGTSVTDDALTSCVQELRRVFADDPRRPQVIETRPRRGYRFIAALSAPEPAAPPDGATRNGGISTIAVLPFADMSPGHDQDYLCDGVAEELIGAREGIRRAEHVLALNPRDGRALSLGGIGLFFDGQTARGVEWTERSATLYPKDPSALINAACARAKSNQTDGALELLERVFARGWGKRDWIEHDPDYDNLRGNPRFERLLAKLK